APAVSLSIKNKEITEILPILFADLPFTYQINRKVIAIKPKVKQPLAPNQMTIRGRVTDSIGKPLEGVIVELEGTSLRTATDKQGYYVLNEVLVGGKLVFRLIGHKMVKVFVNRPEINVVLY